MGCLKEKVRYNPGGAVSPLKHPRLTNLIAAKTIWIQDGEYLGRASDGVVVNLGTVCFEDSAEKYLNTCPDPKDW